MTLPAGPEIVRGHVAIFSEPPRQTPTAMMPDGPLLGNGDLGVVLGGPPEAQAFYFGKNDFWRQSDATTQGAGSLTLAIPALRGATYRQEQDMEGAEVRGTFAVAGGVLVRTRCWVDANRNLLVIRLRCEGGEGIAVSMERADGAGDEAWFTKRAEMREGSREVAVVSRVLGAAVGPEGGALEFTLRPGAEAWVVSAVLGDLDAEDPLAAARELVRGLSPEAIAAALAEHQAWWRAFWSRSWIEIPNKEIEKRWYAALYILGSCSRAGKVAPGLWGSWVTTDQPRWHGDYHLNYNAQAPYYIVYSANHAELALPFYQAIIESLPEGRAMAARQGWKGVALPVGIGPWGWRAEPRDRDLGQRSNAAFAALNFIWHWEYTQDVDFLRDTAYPYLSEVAAFWEDYLVLEGGRYVIYNDSVHEKSGPDFNPLLSLALVRRLFKSILAMSEELGVDVERRAKWLDIVARLSPFPLQEREGKTIYRYSEAGMAWNDSNTLGIQHIFPAGAIGLESDAETLAIARATIEVMNRWSDFNGFSSWYTACVRIGYDPATILARLRKECDRFSLPNLLVYHGGGGIENCSGLLAINEMLLQSHEGLLRLFPVWPREMDARFRRLRAVGAFLVSAELKGGVVAGVEIVSEKGRGCTLQNPWPGRRVLLARAGGNKQTLAGDRLSFETGAGEIVQLESE